MPYLGDVRGHMLPGDPVKRTTIKALESASSYGNKSSAFHRDERYNLYELFGCDELKLRWCN